MWECRSEGETSFRWLQPKSRDFTDDEQHRKRRTTTDDF